MKNKVLIVLLCAFALGLECKAQYNGDKAVLVGTVRADGYQSITKGAFWKQRPEAKQIYEGFTPSGYTSYVLDKPSFGRFIDREHNNNDKNYIIFPKGAIVYTDNTTGKFYAAVCGNEIEYLGPVERFVVQEREKIVVQQSSNSEFSGFGSGLGTPTLPQATGQTVNSEVQNLGSSSSTKEKKKEVKVGKIVLIGGGSGLLAGAIVFVVKALLNNNHHHDVTPPPIIEPRTMPPGIPTVPATPAPGLPSDPRTMPPGTGG